VSQVENPALRFRPGSGTVPDAPGCYLFRDDQGRVLYVGKARSLRSRLAAYFGAWDAIPERTRGMLAAAADVEWIVVDTEAGALLLEWTLIQRHRPRHNVRFRDDKSYPELVLTTSEPVPRARVQRGRVAPGDRRFGPYVSAADARATLDLLLRVFPVRTCSDGVYDRARRADRPCLLHHIGRCAAPCTGEVTPEEHRTLVDGLAGFLGGRTTATLERLEGEMRAAAADQRFEAAAVLRDRLEAARRVTERQQVVRPSGEELDAVAVHGDDLEAAVHVLLVRDGRLVGQTGWIAERQDGGDLGALVTSCVLALYADRGDDVPPTVMVPVEPEDREALEALLTERRGGRVRILVPQRGGRRELLDLVEENARQAFARARLRRASDLAARSAALDELRVRLDLPDAPLRIECFDVSHLGGTGVVAAMVVFEDGLPRRDAYRRFKLRVDANDDPAAMREVLRRRFERLLHERSSSGVASGAGRGFATAPDLVLVDGGPTQLAAALEGVADLPLDGVSFAALSKRLEELWRPDRAAPIVLPRDSEALYLVQRIRDEAHRVAITYQRERRRSAVRGSTLEEVPGIGPARRRALLAALGSVAAIRAATDAELLAVPGVSPTLVAALREHLGGSEVTGS
jgi:excinuclease ABC subunit C